MIVSGQFVGYGRGDTGPEVERVRYYLTEKFAWARAMGITHGDVFDELTEKVLIRFQIIVGLPATGIANYATRLRLYGLKPTPWQRITVYTFAGTWSASDWGIQADVARGLDASFFTWVPVEYPASFGPIPGGPSAGGGAPSYQESVAAAVSTGIRQVNNTPGKLMIGGYSQGGEAASLLLKEILGGSLTHRRGDLVGGYTFGNPSREANHTWPGDSLPGRGISPNRIVGTPSTWHDYAHAGDMYTATPNDDAGDDITAVYSVLTRLQIHDPWELAQSIVAALKGKGGLVEQITELLGNPLHLIDAARAAGIALQFLASGLRDHGNYWEDDVMDGSGRTSVQHAIDSMNAYGRKALAA
ncbi:peptidoglycan-binding protein [Mycobacteroides abscessus]|uniref:peptidoglycan-binding protein n=1 Tax=Mycobacteroides abscessus TaxID=36809 RepID=UPI00092790A3|nr:peptidoglycan-binding protein [Mycobacteroides abscessus]DAZ90364.1 TPA_asm: lysin B [Mycobacterium phage prophiFSQJ01-1]SII41714.1 Bacteriophage protein [Mycobacteroides abscessus subsp. abscessus]SIK13407.1 Bacteriophage protein [Mycobacteroides abscessus subsp. abscessus]SIN25814.1 Bacteriophage protein [Mycobacteroides abscessus subsp. abscessus]SLI51128.1 Bacteriophage protein [Mycobacteroides abscessus subsp. abscessus]